MKTELKIAGLGEVLWDAFPDGELFGGAPANFACHCHSLGAQAYVISSIGHDERGNGAAAFLNNHGINTSCLVQTDSFETGVVIVTLDEAGKPTYEIKENVAWDNIPWTGKFQSVAEQMDAVCFGSLAQRNTVSRTTIRKFIKATKPDCLRVFDINLRQNFYSTEVILPSLEMANVLKLNDEELPVVASMLNITGSDEEMVKAIVMKCGLKLAVLTCGEKGALMITPSNVNFTPAPKIKVQSSVGAGDSFTAAVIMGFLHNKPLNEINRTANELAAFVCTQQGAVPTLPERITSQI